MGTEGQCSSLSSTPCPCEQCKKRRETEACNCNQDLFSRKTEQRNYSQRNRQTRCSQNAEQKKYSQRRGERNCSQYTEQKDYCQSSGQTNYNQDAEQNKSGCKTGLGNYSQDAEQKNYSQSTGLSNYSKDAEQTNYSQITGLINYSQDAKESSTQCEWGGICTFLKEAVRILIYFAFLTLCLLGILLCYAVKLGCKLYQSKNRLQILTLICVGIIALYLVHFAATLTNSKHCSMTMKECQKPQKKALETSKKSGKVTSNAQACKRVEAGKSSVFPKFWSQRQQHKQVETLAAVLKKGEDNRAEEIMRKLKLYSIPMDMKRPPQLLVFLLNMFYQ